MADLVHLLTVHDIEERRLIQLARAGKLSRYDPEWGLHDDLERTTLFAWAAATDEEYAAAVDAYDRVGA